MGRYATSAKESHRSSGHPLADCVHGALAGLIAAAPMTWTMRAAQHAVPRREGDRIPPRQVAEGVLHQADVDHELDRESKDIFATLSHYAFGSTAGTLVGAAVTRSPLPRPVTGALVGLGVWAASYLGWLPAFGVRRPATEDTPQRNAQMIAAHIVWGAVAGLIAEELSVEDRPR